MARLKVEVTGDAASYAATLGFASSETSKFGDLYRAEFASMSTSTLALATAQDKLAISTARYGAGTTGAARATVAYRHEVDALRATQLRAATEVGSALTRYVTAPTLVAAFAAVKFGVDFERQMTMVHTQAGASAQEVKNLSGQVIDLAKSSAFGPTELAKGLYHLESLGLRGAKAMDVLKVSSDAAFLGIANMEDVTTALGGAVVTGIKGVGDYQHAMGLLDATIGAGNMRMEDLIGALGTGVLPAAKNAGVGLDEVGAALAVMTDRGVDAASAGTRLRMTFALMQDQSPKAKKALEDLGIGEGVLAETLRGPDGLLKALELLHDGMASVGKVQGSQDVLKAFGGGRSGAGILTLVQSLDSTVSSFQGKLDQIRAQSDTFAEKVTESQQTAAYKIDHAWAMVKADLTQLGGAIAPGAVIAAESVGKIADAFEALPAPVRNDLGIVVGLLAIGGPLLLAVLGANKMIGSLGKAFDVLPVKAVPAIAATEAELATLPVAAETAAVRTEASLAAIGTTAEATTAKVSLLRGALGSLMILGGAVLAGQLLANQFDHGDKATSLAQLKEWAKGTGTQGELAREVLAKMAAQHPTGMPAGIQGPTGSAPTATVPAGIVGPLPVIPPLTTAQSFADALIAHPDDLGLLRQKATQDQAALDEADRLRKAGKITNTKYQELYAAAMGDLVQTEQQISSIVQSAANAAKSARDEATRKAKQIRDDRARAIKEAIPAWMSGEFTADHSTLAMMTGVPHHAVSGVIDSAAMRAEFARASIPGHVSGSFQQTFEVPMGLRIAQARAATTATTADDARVAREINSFTEKMIHTGRERGQALIDAFNQIAQDNSLLTNKALDGFNLTIQEQRRRSLDRRYADEYHARAAEKMAAGVTYAPTFHSTDQAAMERKARQDFFRFRNTIGP